MRLQRILGNFILFLFFMMYPIRGQDIEWLTPELMDLGRIQQGTLIHDAISFVNTGNESITVDNVHSSCGCTIAKIEKKVIAPGDTGHVDFTLKTRGFRGIVRKSMRITFKEYPNYIKLILLQVDGFTNIDFDPSFLFLNDAIFQADSTYHLDFQIKNNADRTIHFHRIYGQDSSLIILPQNMVLEAGEDNTVHIYFKPPNAARMYFPILFETDDPVQKTVTYRFHVRFKDTF